MGTPRLESTMEKTHEPARLEKKIHPHQKSTLSWTSIAILASLSYIIGCTRLCTCNLESLKHGHPPDWRVVAGKRASAGSVRSVRSVATFRSSVASLTPAIHITTRLGCVCMLCGRFGGWAPSDWRQNKQTNEKTKKKN
jgi:hypothetical protein